MITATTFRAMGCRVEIKLDAAEGGDAILAQLPAKLEALEDRLSRFRPHSELMQLNARAGSWIAVSDVLFENVRLAKHMARLTDGLFNPLVLPALIANGYDRSFERVSPLHETPPRPAMDWRLIELDMKAQRVRLPAGSAIDLGGSAKGWSAQRLCAELAAYGPCLVNIGGDVALHGIPDGYPGWQVEIADPAAEDHLAALWLHDMAIVTSGTDYRRWTTADGQARHHIINPLTGTAATTDVLTVTVIHRDAPTAEAYAKAILLKGSEAGLHWLDSRWDAAGLVVRRDGAVLATSDFVSHLQQGIVL